MPRNDISAVEAVRALCVANRFSMQNVRLVLAHLHRQGDPDSILGFLEAVAKADDDREPTGLFTTGTVGGFIALTIPDYPLDRSLDRAVGQLRRPPNLGVTVDSFAFERNVSFLYDGAKRVEGLLVGAPGAVKWSASWARSLRELSIAVGDAASDQGFPILFLFGPSAPPREATPSTVSGLEPDWRLPAGNALRFSVAVSRADVDSELTFWKVLAARAAALDCGLFARRSEEDRQGPGWEELVPMPGWEDPLDIEPMAAQRVAVTAVGPARVGTTRAFLRRCADEGLGLLSVAVTALDGLAVIHAEVVPIPDDDLHSLDSEMDSERAADLNAEPGPRSILDGVSHAQSRFDGWLDGERYQKLSDYVVWRSSRTGRMSFPPANLKPLWIAWQTPNLPGATRATIATLQEALQARLRPGATCQIEHLIVRESAEDVRRGRGKITIAVDGLLDGDVGSPSPGAEQLRRLRAELGKACALVERDWRNRLRLALGTPWIETEIVWQERWIGRLEAFLAKR